MGLDDAVYISGARVADLVCGLHWQITFYNNNNSSSSSSSSNRSSSSSSSNNNNNNSNNKLAFCSFLRII